MTHQPQPDAPIPTTRIEAGPLPAADFDVAVAGIRPPRRARVLAPAGEAGNVNGVSLVGPGAPSQSHDPETADNVVAPNPWEEYLADWQGRYAALTEGDNPDPDALRALEEEYYDQSHALRQAPAAPVSPDDTSHVAPEDGASSDMLGGRWGFDDDLDDDYIDDEYVPPVDHDEPAGMPPSRGAILASRASSAAQWPARVSGRYRSSGQGALETMAEQGAAAVAVVRRVGRAVVGGSRDATPRHRQESPARGTGIFGMGTSGLTLGDVTGRLNGSSAEATAQEAETAPSTGMRERLLHASVVAKQFIDEKIETHLTPERKSRLGRAAVIGGLAVGAVVIARIAPHGTELTDSANSTRFTFGGHDFGANPLDAASTPAAEAQEVLPTPDTTAGHHDFEAPEATPQSGTTVTETEPVTPAAERLNVQVRNTDTLWSAMQHSGVPPEEIMHRLHEAATKAQEAGMDVEWHGSGTHEWVEVNGKSGPRSVMKALSPYLTK
jgi:hypothetical protein